MLSGVSTLLLVVQVWFIHVDMACELELLTLRERADCKTVDYLTQMRGETG